MYTLYLDRVSEVNMSKRCMHVSHACVIGVCLHYLALCPGGSNLKYMCGFCNSNMEAIDIHSNSYILSFLSCLCF